MVREVILTKISSSHNNLRTEAIVGTMASGFEVGERIVIFAAPLDRSRNHREVVTTPVEKIEGNLYYTANSIYKLEFL